MLKIFWWFFLVINCKRGIFKYFQIFIFSKILKFSVLHLKTIIKKNEIYDDYIKHFLNICFKSRGWLFKNHEQVWAQLKSENLWKIK